MSASDSYFTSIPGYTTLSDQAQGSKAPPSTPVRVRSRRKYWPLLKAKVDLSMDPNGTGSTRSRSYRSRVIQQVSQTLDGGAGHHERRRDSGNSERSSETVIVTDTNSRSQSGASTTFDLNGSSAISGAPFDRSTPASGNRKTVRIPIPARGGSIKAANPTRGLSLDSGGGSGRRRSSANGKPAARVHFAMDDPSDLHQSEVFRERLYPIPFSALKLEPRLCSDYPTQPLRHKHKLLGRPQTPLPSPTLVNAFKATDPTFGRPRQKKIRSWIPPYLRRSDRHTRTLEARHGTREVSRALWDGRTHHTPPGRQSLGKAFESQGNGEDRFQDAFMDFGSPVNDEIHPVAYANQCLEERQAKIKSEDFDGTSERLSRNSHEVKTTSWPLRVKPHPKYRVAVFSPEDAVQPREEHFLDSYSMNDYPRATARMAASDPNDLSSASKPETDGQKSDGQDELVRLRQWSLPARPKDWSHTRKRFAASVVCSNTALIGLVVGIYAGEVPAFQYQLADMGHYTVLGNVVFYVGLSIPTLLCWTLPLIYGRKPFNVMALGLFLPLQLPQAVVLSSSRSPDNASYRTGLLVARALSGIALGFLNTNMLGSLVELFGASLHNSHPHQETFKRHDLRRHGGGMGVWLGVWTWSFVGSVGLGFLFGALIINQLNPVWGFWITSALSAVMLLLNMATPEIRDPLDQWSAAQHYLGSQRSSEGLRGNATILRSYATPQRLWHEIQAGVALKCSMLSQVGFTPLALYVSWIYGHAVMVMILLGRLISVDYGFTSPYVGLCVAALPLGALLAVPFQKRSSIFPTNDQQKRSHWLPGIGSISWSSHLIRRSCSLLLFPIAGLGFAITSKGPSMPWAVPTLFAALMGFLSTLAAAECTGLIMETFDVSDLTLNGMQRTTGVISSSYPRISAAFAIIQSFSFLFAAATTGFGGPVVRKAGTQTATGIVDGVTFLFSILAIASLWRGKHVQVVSSSQHTSQASHGPRDFRQAHSSAVRNSSVQMRKMSLLELGDQSRWTEIRRGNRLIQ